MGRLGRQEPTFEVLGEWDHTDGPECVSTLEAYGFSFDGAQRHEMDAYLARTASGRPAATTTGVCKPRQNGKSYGARWYAVWCAAMCGMSVTYSAHNGDTVHEFFDMLCDVFTDDGQYPDFATLLEGRPYRQPGKERIGFVGGGRIKFVTRTNSGSRGGTCDVLVVDEAQELTDAQANAMLPIISAGPHGAPQVIYIGTPPDASCPGTVFARMHDAAHSDDPGSAWWMEWAVPELPPEGATADELVELAYETNPALGSRITEEAVRNEVATMSRDGFARERLGWWRPGSASAPTLIDPEAWEGCLVVPEAAARDGKLAYGVKFSPDGSMYALSACVLPREGLPHVELVDVAGTSRGVDGLASWLLDRARGCAMVAVDGRSGAAALCQRLREGGAPANALHECGAADVVAAASMLVDAVRAREVTHIDSPALDESATRSVRREVGRNGAAAFGDGPNSTSVPVESAALALWAARTSRRDPSRKGLAG